jgi:hypothetical protein
MTPATNSLAQSLENSWKRAIVPLAQENFMEHLYPLLTLFSGGTIVLLGSFLFASERELKKKRRELDELKRKRTASSDTSTDGPLSEMCSSDAIRENDELRQEISALSSRLEQSQTSLDERQSQEIDAARLHSENQDLNVEKQRLLGEIATLERQLQTDEDRLNGISSQYAAVVERHEHLQAGFAESKQQMDEVTTKNKQLQEEVDSISSQLTAAEKSVEDLRVLEQNERLDNQQLLEANQRLKGKIEAMHGQLETLQSQLDESIKRHEEAAKRNEELQIALLDQKKAATKELRDAERRVQEEHESHRTQLDAKENRLQESVRQYQEISDRCARLEAEVSDYRQQLEHSQSPTGELETAREQRANVDSREMSYREQQQKLEALIGDLERELSEGKSQVEALEETHKRLWETERICQQLGDENRRLGEEISRWQQRLAASEENQKQVSLLRQQLDALRTEHARVIDKNGEIREDLVADDEAIGVSSPVALDSDGVMMIQSKMHTVSEASSELTGSGETRGHLLGSSDSAPGTQVVNEVKASQIVWSSIARNWHFGAVFTGLIILVIAGATSIKILTTEGPTSGDPVVLAPEKTSVQDVAEPASKPRIRAAPRLRGAFQTVRLTQVFSGPSENSALIANIGQGVKLNVVDSRDGWLEIRSKHGRPPGFIRQEAAVRIGSN